MKADYSARKQIKIVAAPFLACLLLLTALTPVHSGQMNSRQPGLRDFISRYDQDGDERITLEEFSSPEKQFNLMDANRDGYIDRDEAPKGPPRNPVAAFDQDGDGKLSMEEFPGPDDHFNCFDKNGDGYLSTEEAPKGPPPKARADQSLSDR